MNTLLRKGNRSKVSCAGRLRCCCALHLLPASVGGQGSIGSNQRTRTCAACQATSALHCHSRHRMMPPAQRGHPFVPSAPRPHARAARRVPPALTSSSLSMSLISTTMCPARPSRTPESDSTTRRAIASAASAFSASAKTTMARAVLTDTRLRSSGTRAEPDLMGMR